VRGDKLAQLMPSGGLPCDGAVGSWKATLALNVLSQKIEKIEKIEHVGRILFHRASSLALQPSEDYASIVRQSFAERHCLAQVTPGRVANSARVMWPVPSPQPLVSLLVPTRDGVEILKPCVDAILERTDYRHFELFILDNQSSCASTLAYMEDVEKRDARVKVLRWDHDFNYSAINNFGAQHANGDIIGLINNDVEPVNGKWLTEMVSQASRPEIGCVGAKLYYPNGTVQHGGVILGLGGVAGHAHRFFQQDEEGYAGRLQLVQNLTAVTAACLLLRREVFEKVGGLNEIDLTVAYNDVDLCLKVHELGLRNLWTPYAELYHHESISRGDDNTPKKRARALKEARYMREQWGPLLDNDPAYNPNLTLVHEDFSLR
jgi:GT2 family glycosyltransferase